MTNNLVRELLAATGLTKPQLAKKVGRSPNLIAAWASEPKPEEARRLAEVAGKAGRRDLAHALLVLAGDEREEAPGSPLERLTGDERRLAECVIEMYRHPANDVQRGVIQVAWGVAEMQDMAPDWAASLSEEQMDVLRRLARVPHVIDSVRTILAGYPQKGEEGDLLRRANGR